MLKQLSLSRPSRLLLSAALAAGLLLVLLYRIGFDDSGVLASRALQADIAKLIDDNAVQARENNALKAQVRDLKLGHNLLEEIAREELGLIRPGERFFLFDDQP